MENDKVIIVILKFSTLTTFKSKGKIGSNPNLIFFFQFLICLRIVKQGWAWIRETYSNFEVSFLFFFLFFYPLYFLLLILIIVHLY